MTGSTVIPIPAALLWPLTALVAVCAVVIYRRAQKYPDLGPFVASINTVLYPLRWLRIFPFVDGNKLCIERLMQEAMQVR